MRSAAVVLEKPGTLGLRELTLVEPVADDVIVEVSHSGISTGTERLLWSGAMPPFPGLAYPLVPGYEAVGTVVDAGSASGCQVGETVFVPGSHAFADVRCLFGAAGARLVAKGARVSTVDAALGADAVLLALAATARHAIVGTQPDLIVGHGVLGRLLARLAVAAGAEPVVWETNPDRRAGAEGYRVTDPEDDTRRDYRTIIDASGDAAILDALVARLAPGGEIVLAGFYSDRVSFAFPPAFMKEARIRIAAEWKAEDMAAVCRAVADAKLSLAGLVTHTRPAVDASEAYRTAFQDPACLKMALAWS